MPRRVAIATKATEVVNNKFVATKTYHQTPVSERVCPHCGYDLREQFKRDGDPVVCPECGKSVRSEDCLIPKVFFWRVPVLCVAIPQTLAMSTMFGLRGEYAAGIPLFVFGAGVIGVVAASITGAARTWNRIGERVPRGRRIAWTTAAVLENGFAAGVTAFALMFPFMVIALIWREATK
ncbi:MAG: hypothetical protein KF691_04550 [Phycisphaeraceae bacterium]|nr:hypothetical protein [Phycisphaeraceae bacterium]